MSLTKQEFEATKTWGISCCIDLYNCNPQTIRDAQKIKDYVKQLCNLIKVKPFGECTVVNFGQDKRIAGYSMTQLIETSLLSGHFANQTNTAYLDIFSCKYYDPSVVLKFSKKYFESETAEIKCNLRS